MWVSSFLGRHFNYYTKLMFVWCLLLMLLLLLLDDKKSRETYFHSSFFGILINKYCFNINTALVKNLHVKTFIHNISMNFSWQITQHGWLSQPPSYTVVETGPPGQKKSEQLTQQGQALRHTSQVESIAVCQAVGCHNPWQPLQKFLNSCKMECFWSLFT